MTYKYIIISENCEELGVLCYGIQAVCGDHIVAQAHDISRDKGDVLRLVDLCNSLELSVVHFYDVVEDFIG